MTAMQQMLMSYGSNKLTQRSYGMPTGFDTALYSVTGNTNQRGGGFTPENTGQSYLLMWSATYNGNDTSNDILAGISIVNELATTIGTIEYNVEPKDTADYYSIGGIYGYNGVTDQGKYFSLIYGTEASNTTTMDSSGALVLTLAGNDVYTVPSPTSETAATWLTVGSVTVPTTGFYVLMAHGSLMASVTSGTLPRVRVFDGTNSMGEITNGYRKDTANNVPYNHVEVRQFTANTIISLQIQGDGTNTTTISNPGLAILYIGASTSEPVNMPNFYSASSAAQSTTTSTSFTTKASGTFTIANPSNQHLLIASAHVAINDTSYSVFSELINTSTSVDYNDIDWVVEAPAAPVSSNPQWYTLFLVRTVTFTQSSNTIAWRYRSENTAATAYIKDATLVLIDLGVT